MTEKKIDIQRLNCMNYCVDNGEEAYYLQCGLRSLYNFCKRHEENFKEVCTDLNSKGYFVIADEITQIEMI